MNINGLSLLDKMVQVATEVMRMLDVLFERVVTRDDSEWAAAMASLTASQKVRTKPSGRQHKKTKGIVGQ